MTRFPHLRLAVGLLVLLAVGSLQGSRLGHLRQSEAFYRWINAAAVNERVFREEEKQGKNSEDRDDELYKEIAGVVEPMLAGQNLQAPAADVLVPENTKNQLCESKLCLLASNPIYDKQLWALAKSDKLAPQRQKFLDLIRKDRLSYASGIPYAQALRSGANVSLFNLFFGFRKVAANFLWIEVDRYWHQGMYWRMIPIMKACVALDPNFVDAYLLGAWHLAYNATAKLMDTPPQDRVWLPKYQVCVGEKEKYYYFGVDFLKDGIRNNPRDFRLYFDLGFAIYEQKLKDYPNAVKYLTEAVRHPHERWVPRQLYEAMEKNAQYGDALRGWEDYNKRFPNTSDVAPRFIKRNHGEVAEQQMRAERQLADMATDAAEKKKHHDTAQKYEDEARTIWTDLGEPFAVARLLRMGATKLAAQGRFMEAVALLDKARNESNEMYWSASDTIIEYKQRGGLPLSLSEKKAILRKEQGDVCQGMPANLSGAGAKPAATEAPAQVAPASAPAPAQIPAASAPVPKTAPAPTTSTTPATTPAPASPAASAPAPAKPAAAPPATATPAPKA